MKELAENRYFITGNLAKTEKEVIRITALLRGTESAAQHVPKSMEIEVTRFLVSW